MDDRIKNIESIAIELKGNFPYMSTDASFIVASNIYIAMKVENHLSGSTDEKMKSIDSDA